MIMANAVAVLPTWTDRLDGRIAATSGLVLAGVVIRPILPLPSSMNHNAPSGPAVMPPSPPATVGTGYSVIAPGVLAPRFLCRRAGANHNAPSGPATIPAGALDEVGMLNSVI